MLKILFTLLLLVSPASAQYIGLSGGSSGGGAATSITAGTTTITGCSDKQVLFTDTTVLGCDAGLTYTKTTDALAVTGSVAIGGATIGTNALAVTGTAIISSTFSFGTTNNQVASGVALGGPDGLWFRGAASYELAVYSGGVRTKSGSVYGWASSTIDASLDTNLSRQAAGVVQVGTTSANSSGTILAAAAGLGGATVGSNALAVTGTVFASGKIYNYNSGTGTGTNVDTTGIATYNGFSSIYSLDSARINIRSTSVFSWSSNTNADAAFDTNLSRQSAGVIQFGTTSANAAGSLLATDGTFSNNLYVLTFLGFGGSTGSALTWARSQSSGVLTLYGASLGAFDRLQFGNTTSSFPSLKRSGTGLLFQLADDSGLTSWTAAKGTLTGGTLADQAQVLSITATQPTTPTGIQNAIAATITSAGSASQLNRAVYIEYGAGYTGSHYTIGYQVLSQVSGTGTSFIAAAGANNGAANYGAFGTVSANTVGTNKGVHGDANGGNINIGVSGIAQVAKNSATNIGGVFSAINTGTTPTHIGVFASLNQTTVPTVSAALIADNGATTDPIMLLRDNGTTVFTVADGGTVTATGTIVAGNFSTTGDIVLGAGNYLNWSSRGQVSFPVNGNLLIQNNATTDFGRLMFGGTTNAFVAVKRFGTALAIRQADDTVGAFAALTACAAGGEGALAVVTDSSTATWGDTVTGSGANRVLAYCNGTNWTVAAK